MSNYLFVYGTLKRGLHCPEAKLLARLATFVGDAFFQGRLFLVDAYPGVVPSNNTNDRVHGEVYALEDHAILSVLDAYEGCGALSSDLPEYERRLVVVKTASGKRLEAWIYIYNLPTDRLPRVTSGRFTPAQCG